MKKELFYRIVIVCQLLINIGILLFLWLGHEREHRGHPPRPDRIIIERLKLDEQQQEQFKALRNAHHSHMVVIQEAGGRMHDQLFDLLQKEPEDTAAENVLLGQIQQNELQKEQITLEHFRSLRKILRPDQKRLFDDLVNELSRQIMAPHGPPPDGPLPREGR